MEALRHLHVKGAKLLNYQRVSREEPSCNVRWGDGGVYMWRRTGDEKLAGSRRPMEATVAGDEPSGGDGGGEKRTINTLGKVSGVNQQVK